MRILAIPALLLMLAACETTAGFGRDVEAAGDAVERGADRAGEAITDAAN